MRDYGKLHSEFWTSPTIRALSDDARLMAAYLLTTGHGTLIGCFRLPDGYVAEDLGWPLERVAKGFRELIANGFVTHCETTKFVLIHKFLEWNPLENPNQVKAGVKLFGKIPDSIEGKELLAKALNIGNWEPLRNRYDTVPKPVAVAVAVAVAVSLAASDPSPIGVPAIDLDLELDKAACWLAANPKNLKSNYAKSLRANDGLGKPVPSEKILFDAVDGWRNILPVNTARWRKAYPAIDLDLELEKAACWLAANPKNLKSNYAKFLNSWFSRTQDKAPRVVEQGPAWADAR